jgi:hypothetical protein
MKTRTKKILSRLGTLQDIKLAKIIMVQEEGNERPYRISKDDAVALVLDCAERFTSVSDSDGRLTIYPLGW